MKKNYHAELLPETCYHIYNRSVGGVKMFQTEENYHFFLKQWRVFLEDYMTTYAYCLIPNHFHFLSKGKTVTPKIKIKIAAENTKKSAAFLAHEIDYNDFLVSQFQRFFTSYSSAFNRQKKRTGSLLQKKFKRIIIRDEEHFRFMLLYIHHNGIHHKLVKEYIDWKYSSFPAYLTKEETIIAREPVLKLFEHGNGLTPRETFLKFHEDNKNGLGLYPNLKKWKNDAFDFDWNGCRTLL